MVVILQYNDNNLLYLFHVRLILIVQEEALWNLLNFQRLELFFTQSRSISHYLVLSRKISCDFVMVVSIVSFFN